MAATEVEITETTPLGQGEFSLLNLPTLLNVGAVRTRGDGFGLTKAFLVTKPFGGRFWIRSEPGMGTRIRIEIPRPRAVTR